MQFKEETHGARVAEEMLDKMLAERVWDRVTIQNPLHEHKATIRKVHRSGDQFWVRFNRCRCYIQGVKITTIDGIKCRKYFIGY